MKRHIKTFLISILHTTLRVLARRTVRVYKPYIIAITGSVGKTSAKEAVYSVLKDYKRVRKTQANFNNELGVPLTILGNWNAVTHPAWWFWTRVIIGSYVRTLIIRKSKYPEVLILEYGADKAGDIAYLLSIAHPSMGIITAIGETPVHVEFYPEGVEAVVKEKSRLVHALGAHQKAILNADDSHTEAICKKTTARVITFGQSTKATVRITHIKHTVVQNKITGIVCKIQYEGSEVPFVISHAFSIAHAYAVASAVAVASEYVQLNLLDIAQAIEKYYKPVEGRSVIIPGIKRTQIIDESYNSSPAALEMALKTMQLVAHTRRVAVLGDMLELGVFSIEAHEKAGILAAQCVDVLITVGTRAKLMAQKAIEKGMYEAAVHSFDTAQEAGLKLQEVMKQGDVVLIKGSHAIGLEAVVEEVRA